eukprot:scaffold145130_cov31-Tisochrysis_lutea.AAC.1
MPTASSKRDEAWHTRGTRDRHEGVLRASERAHQETKDESLKGDDGKRNTGNARNKGKTNGTGGGPDVGP